MNQMRTGDEFVLLYNELEQTLKKKTRVFDRRFTELIEAAKNIPGMRGNLDKLRAMGNLRNAIVHEKGYPTTFVADPRQEIVDDLKKILGMINSPLLVGQRFKAAPRTFDVHSTLTEILAHMKQHDYSQVVIAIEGHYKILTSEAIVRWISKAEHEIVDLEGVQAAAVHKHEGPDVQQWISRNSPVDDVVQAYENALKQGIPRIHAILVTKNGKPTEKPSGIVTPWDLIDLIKEMYDE